MFLFFCSRPIGAMPLNEPLRQRKASKVCVISLNPDRQRSAGVIDPDAELVMFLVCANKF